MAKKRNNFSRNDNGRNSGKVSKVKILVFILMVIVGLAAIFTLLGSNTPDFLNGSSLSGKLAAKVNGEEITMQELDEGYDRLSPQYKSFLTKEDFLDQMIDQLLLVQEANRRGIAATDAEAEQNIRDYMDETGTTPEELLELLNSTNMDYAELLEVSKTQLTVEKLLEAEVYSVANITTEEALAYYNENSESFKIPEVLIIRHILVGSILQNRTSEEADQFAEQLLTMITADRSNFCDLVNEYSDDLASKPQCGEYSFPRGQLPLEFDDWADVTDIGEVGIVSSEYGTHVMWLINKTPESLIMFDDAQDEISQALLREKQEEVYDSLIERLRDNADVKNYVAGDEEDVEMKESEENNGLLSPSEEQSTEQTSEMVDEKPVDSMPEEPTQTQSVVTVKGSDGFLDCLADKGAVLYGASWDSQTKQQLSILGSGVSKIKYVECSVAGDYASQTKECSDANVEAYPTWNVGGKVMLGVYAPKQLAEAAGCE